MKNWYKGSRTTGENYTLYERNEIGRRATVDIYFKKGQREKYLPAFGGVSHLGCTHRQLPKGSSDLMTWKPTGLPVEWAFRFPNVPLITLTISLFRRKTITQTNLIFIYLRSQLAVLKKKKWSTCLDKHLSSLLCTPLYNLVFLFSASRAENKKYTISESKRTRRQTDDK